MLETNFQKILKWWDAKILGSLAFLMITHWIQVPHTLTAADCFMMLGWNLIHIHPILDFFLFGIDLIEIPALIVVTFAFIARFRNRKS